MFLNAAARIAAETPLAIRIEAGKPEKREPASNPAARARLELKQQDSIIQTPGEPLMGVVHRCPATGKNTVIGWMRHLMEEGLGWEHGVQFVCLAFQNAMAAQIDGHIVHRWSGIPARNDDGNAMGDRHKQSMKCGALRVIIIDDVSMMSAELLGTLERVVSAAVRERDT